MEVMAAIKGLEAAPPGATAVVHSDSEYLVKTMTKGWKRNVNRDLWEQLDLAVAKRNVDFRWVRRPRGATRRTRRPTVSPSGPCRALRVTLPLLPEPPPPAPSPPGRGLG